MAKMRVRVMALEGESGFLYQSFLGLAVWTERHISIFPIAIEAVQYHVVQCTESLELLNKVR